MKGFAMRKRRAETVFYTILDLAFVLLLLIGLLFLGGRDPASEGPAGPEDERETGLLEVGTPLPDGFSLPVYTGEACTAVNGNEPYFSPSEYEAVSFETYSPRDMFGRCGAAFACVGEDLMPTEPRGAIGMIRPTGWHTVTYDFITDRYLYNRCHLIAYQLAGENANEDNLITGTRYMNVEGMLPFENRVADYILRTHNHVLYRVTPVFPDSDLLARGVLIEAYSVEDAGEGIRFCVFVHNVQPGVEIDYSTGESRASSDPPPATTAPAGSENATYVLNTRSMKFHRPECESVPTIASYNRAYTDKSREELIEEGFTPCGACKP